MRRLLPGGFCLLTLLAAAPAAQPPAREAAAPDTAGFAAPDRRARLLAAAPEIDRIFTDFAARVHAPGAAWGLVVDGELAHAGATGVRRAGTTDAVGSDTVFRIASMTKSFTAMAILKLRDEGRLQLDDPVERHVPELAGLAYPTSDSPRLTIRHLLTHSAGFPEDNPWGDQQLGIDEQTFTAWLKKGIPFSNPPGVAYEYSNYGFAILGRVVSRAAGMPYVEYVERGILRPLGMRATTFEAAAVEPSRLAHGYRWEDETWKDEPALPHGAFGAMGGLLTSVNDLARYVGFLAGAWPPRDGPETGPVARHSAREMQQVWRPSPASARRGLVDGPLRLSSGGYGYGLRVSSSCQFAHSVAHGGGLPGYGSLMTWLPEYGVGFVAMANVTYAGWGRAFEEAFDALARTGALAPRTPQPSAALLAAQDDVTRLVTSWDDTLAERVAAGNLYLDRSKDRRRREIEALVARHGTCRPAGPIEPENALRGTWRLACDRGTIDVTITLAPTQPPLVQYLAVRGALPLDERTAAAASRLADAMGDPSRAAALAAPDADAARLASQLDAARAWGRCRVGEPRDGDGASNVLVRLACDKGEIDARFTLHAPTGRFSTISLTPVGICVP